MADIDSKPTKEEAQSFTWGGTAARPRRNIERVPLKAQTFLKPPGSCQTKWPATSISVNITACEDCNIYLLDVTSQVQISDCHNCRIIVGPCSGSVFLMDSTNCRVAVAAKQLRLRDCRDYSLRIFAPTSESAVVETSKDFTFGCWQVASRSSVRSLSGRAGVRPRQTTGQTCTTSRPQPRGRGRRRATGAR